jgi:hypothetical protein
MEADAVRRPPASVDDRRVDAAVQTTGGRDDAAVGAVMGAVMGAVIWPPQQPLDRTHRRTHFFGPSDGRGRRAGGDGLRD